MHAAGNSISAAVLGRSAGQAPARSIASPEHAAGDDRVAASLAGCVAGRRAAHEARIARQAFAGPPIAYSGIPKALSEIPPPPQDLVADDPMQPKNQCLPVEALRDRRLEQLRHGGPQPRVGPPPLEQALHPGWRLLQLGYDEGLARRLIAHYANGDGREYRLSAAEVDEIAISADTSDKGGRGDRGARITNNVGLHRELAALRAAGGGKRRVAFQGQGGANTHGTLGVFTLLYDGELEVIAPGARPFDDAGSTWRFTGTVVVYDVYDFNRRTERGDGAERLTSIGREGMRGDPFQITSDPVPVVQLENMMGATIGGKPAGVGKPSRLMPGETGEGA